MALNVQVRCATSPWSDFVRMLMGLGPTSSCLQYVSAYFLGSKATGAWTLSLFSSSAKVKNEWSFSSRPPVLFRGVHREKFTFSWLAALYQTEHQSRIVVGR